MGKTVSTDLIQATTTTFRKKIKFRIAILYYLKFQFSTKGMSPTQGKSSKYKLTLNRPGCWLNSDRFLKQAIINMFQ